MISWITSIIEYLGREKCKKLIQYDGKVITLKGLSSKIAEVPFNLADFGIHTEKIREASEIALALDDYQVLMCRMCSALGKDDPQWRKYFDLRASTIQTLT